MTKAYERGHNHLRQFADNAELFKSVGNILFVHMSDKYSARFIKARAKDILPESLAKKTRFGLNMWSIKE